MDKIKVLIVDDHKIIRDGLISILKNDNGIEIIGEAQNGKEAIAFIKSHPKKIDVILLDINMPELGGIETATLIKEVDPEIKIIVLTMHLEDAYIVRMIQAGVKGYIIKESGSEKLIDGVKTVMLGKKFFSDEVADRMSNHLVTGSSDIPTSPFTLTQREKDVLSNIIDGKTTKEIGTKLYISSRTVETHRRNIMQKLKVKNVAEMVKTALEKGLV